MKQIRDFKLYFFLFIPLVLIVGCLSSRKLETGSIVIKTAPANGIQKLEIEFQKGSAFNHPSFVVWVEDMEGSYIETLYVTMYVAKGKFRYREQETGKWKNEPGEARRPATLPYWAHKRNIKAPDGLYIPSPETALPDALTAATPENNFILSTATSHSAKKNFRVLMEINQAWDSNEFWTNNKFPDDLHYKTSLQPSIVYAVTVEQKDSLSEFYLNPIGHSHPSGANGKLFTDLTTLTSAKEIANKVIVRLNQAPKNFLRNGKS